jgi:hypothetical protein
MKEQKKDALKELMLQGLTKNDEAGSDLAQQASVGLANTLTEEEVILVIKEVVAEYIKW